NVDGRIEARAVDVAGGLDHEAAHRAVGPGASGEQVERADDVHLVRAAGVHVERVDASEGVHDGVDADRANQLADQRVPDVELQIVGAPQVISRLADVHAD